MAHELCNAIIEGNLELAEALLENHQNQRDINEAYVFCHYMTSSEYLLVKDNATPLYYASKHGYTNLVSKLLSIPHIVPAKGEIWHNLSPLHVASRFGFSDVVQLLVQVDAGITCDSDNLTPFHYASIHGHTSVIEILIKRYKSHMNDVTRAGNTALQKASEYGHLDIVKLFIENRASFLNRNINGKTAYDIATIKGYTEIARNLFKAGGYVQPDRLHSFVKWFQATKLVRVATTSTEVIAEGLKLLDDKLDSLAAHNVSQDKAIASVQSDVSSLKDSQNVLVGKLDNVHQKLDNVQKRVTDLEQRTNLRHGSRGNTFKNKNTEEETRMREKIQSNFEYLKDNIMSEDHIDYLFQEKALTQTDLEVIGSKAGRTNKTREMLYTLLGKPQYDWVYIFRNSLERNNGSKELAQMFY